MDSAVFPLILINGFYFICRVGNDIGPTEASMLLCSYENRTKEMLDPKKWEDGTLKLSVLLMEEDFAITHSVYTSIYHPSFMVITLFGSLVQISAM